MESKLVSIIIPCFNAQRWLAEAIDSCLQQTYSNIEIIVIDDGSTDKCLEIIKNYGDKVKWESGPNRGGNYARNRGLALSSGEYIQYLDADDYILPGKIERQVRFLEKTGADVVYGDWRARRHLPDGTTFLEDIVISGVQADMLEALLGTWWVAVAALLYKRAAVENSDGWDESLRAAQDRDFFISVVMNGAKVVYQPGCYSVYRRYGNTTVSTSCKNIWLKSHRLLMEKAETKLSNLNRFSLKYRHALATSYFYMAREALCIDYLQYLKFIEKALILFPEFQHSSNRAIYRFFQRICGFRITERIACFLLLRKKSRIVVENLFVGARRKAT